MFSSIQGEGLLVGLRQAFIRFCGCNLACRYCDTENRNPDNACLLESTPGRRDFITVPNPVTLGRLMGTLEGWREGWPGVHHSISITGGEPLLCTEILTEWLPELRKLFPIYLETNGTLFSELAEVIDHIDYISMDIKLPSTTNEATQWDSHHKFLDIAARRNVFVKIVVGETTEDWEIIKACETIASVNKETPLILQPISLEGGKVGLSPFKALEFQELSSRYLKEVRVIPQTHKFMGQL